MKELGRRLKDQELAQRLPPAALMSLATKYVNYLDVKARIANKKREHEKEQTVLEVIENPEMDPVRRLEILDNYIAAAEADLKTVKARRREVLREAKVLSIMS